MQFAWKLGVLMLVALAILVLPGGGGALNVVLSFLTIAFLGALAVLGYRLYRQYRLDLDSLEPNSRLVLYSSVGLAIVTFVATNRLVNDGIGILVWFALLALCSYGLFWVWTQWRKYT